MRIDSVYGFGSADCPGHDAVEVELVVDGSFDLRNVHFSNVERWVVEEIRWGAKVLIADVTVSMLQALWLKPNTNVLQAGEKLVMRVRNTRPEARVLHAVACGYTDAKVNEASPGA